MALGAALALVLAEGGLRLVATLCGMQRGMTYDAELGWRLLPNVTKVGPMWGGGQPTTTNSQGWRDDEFVKDPTPGKTRVVALGDSFTFGVNVPFGERFTEFLEQANPKLEVLNFGVNAYGTDQELRVLETEAIGYRPEVVLLVTFLGNDLEDIRYRYLCSWPKPYYYLRNDRLQLVSPSTTWALSLRTSLYLGELTFRACSRFVDHSELAPEWRDRDALPLYLELVKKAAAVANAGGARFMVVLVHLRERNEVAEGRVVERLRRGLHWRAVEVMDTRSLFVGADDCYLPDGHWNARGHRRLASAVLEKLRALGWCR